jgi:hypothetical protein
MFVHHCTRSLVGNGGHPSQDVNPGLPNICAAPPSAALDTDIGMQIVGTLNLSAIGPHAVYALYFRLNDLC